MSHLDQAVTIGDEAYASLSLSTEWQSLERATKRKAADAATAMGALGSELGRALFPPNAQQTDTLIDNLATAQREHRSLRLTFAGNAARLPVEFTTLAEETLERCRAAGVSMAEAAIALHSNVELLRNVDDAPIEIARVEVSKAEPLRVLIAVANPGHGNWLTIPRAEPQARMIESACRGIAGDYAKLSFLADATPLSLSKALDESRPDILHFVGHGAKVSDGVAEPSLVLAANRGQGVAFFSVRELLASFHRRPQFISLNACHLGGSDPSMPGFAEALSEAGVPVVLAMQLPVDDTVAEHVAEGVYRPLLRGLPVSLAVANVRRQFAIDSRLRFHPQWATPVLLSRSVDTTICHGIPVTGVAEARSRSAAQQFVGREWLWAKVKPNLETPHAAVVLLEAEAGLGKSSFLEHCLRELESSSQNSNAASASLLLTYRYRYGEQSDAAACARALANQLEQWLQENGKPLPKERSANAYDSPYVRACAELDEFITAATQHAHVVLLIDALDEASDAQDALPIGELVGNLPANLSVFVTARPEWYTQWRRRYPAADDAESAIEDSRFTATVLEPLSATNLRDVAYFIYQSFQPYRLAVSQVACLELATNARGSFLVADILLGMLRKGDDEARIKERFRQADSVTGAYDLVFRMLAADLVGDSEAARRLRDTEDLLAFITCAQEPVTEEQLQRLFGARSDGCSGDVSRDVADALHHLRRFLSSDLSEYGEPLYRPYHQSLRSYGQRRLRVAQTTDADGDRPADSSLAVRKGLPRPASEYRRIWADYCLQWQQLERYPAIYALRNLVPHLVALDGDETLKEIEQVLTDYSYIAAALGADPGKPERPLHVNELIARYDSAERRRAGT